MLLLGIFSRRANKNGLTIGIIACVIFTAYAVLTTEKIDDKTIIDLGSWNFGHHKYMLGVYSHLILFGVGYLASYFFPKPVLNDNLTYHGRSKRRREALKQG